MKLAAALAGGVLLLGGLSACGGSDTDAYCDDIAAAADQFAGLENADPSQIGEAFGTLRNLGEDPPEEVAAEWEVLTGGLADFEQALEDAGLSIDELADLGSLNPEDFDPEALQSLTETSQELQSAEFTEAGDAIREHAQSECDVDLPG